VAILQLKLAAVRQLATLKWLVQLTQAMTTVQQKLAARVRQLVAVVEWPQ